MVSKALSVSCTAGAEGLDYDEDKDFLDIVRSIETGQAEQVAKQLGEQVAKEVDGAEELEEYNDEEPYPSVLEYARFHGMCADYRQEKLLVSLQNDSTGVVDADLELLEEINLANTIAKLMEQRLTVSKEAAFLLHSIYLMQERREELPLQCDNLHRARQLKVEEPVLRTDAELDLLDFGSTALPDLTKLKISLLPASTMQDESLEWSTKYLEYPRSCDAQACAEKLTITREEFMLLQSVIKDTRTQQDTDDILAKNLTYNKSSAREPVTPPLLPQTPPPTPYVPSSPGNRLDLLSESTNSTAAELKALDDRIMKEDVLVPRCESGESGDTMLLEEHNLGALWVPSHNASPKDSSPTVKRKWKDLRVEGPLTPPTFSDSPTKKLKTVSFSELLHKYIPDLTSMYETGGYTTGQEEDFMDLYKEFEPLAIEVNRKLENEKLSEADTTKRQDVPTKDFTLPVAPWAEFALNPRPKWSADESELDAQIKFLHRIKREELKSASIWPGVSKLERSLPWRPIPIGAGIIAVEEQIEDNGFYCKLLEDIATGEMVTSSSLTWKPEGLRIFADNDDEDEELEAVECQVEKNMEILLRKRRLEMEEAEAERACEGAQAQGPAQQPPVPDAVEHSRYTNSHFFGGPLKSVSLPTLHPAPSLDNGLMFGGGFSASSALSKFMVMQGQTTEPSAAPSQQPPVHQRQDMPSSRPCGPIALAEKVDEPAVSQEAPKVLSPAPLDLPPIPESLPPCSLIMSSTLLQNRRLVRSIKDIYKKVEITERDFSAPHSPAKEADLLLSPSTGLILTTLQQVKQRALPGQPDRSPLKERMIRLQARYERLVILISQGLNLEMEKAGLAQSLDARDREVMSALEDFASQLEATVIVKFVKGGPEALTRVIVQQMARWGLPHGSKDIGGITLLQDETQWEMFLRRCGFNAFAAQAILTSLKEELQVSVSPSPHFSSGSESKYVSVYGLSAFVMMTAEERVQRFQILVGGSRILRKVSALLDGQWPSAAHGFAM